MTPEQAREAEARTRAAWSPDEVLDEHTALAGRFIRPDVHLVGYARYFMADAYAKGGERAWGMFYPVNGWRGTPSDGEVRAYLAEQARALRTAQTYEVSAEMVEVMRQVHDRTHEHVVHLDEHEVPSPAGFAWLDRPWVINDIHHNLIPIRAVSWELTSAWTRGTESQRLPAARKMHGARLTFWTHYEDDKLFRPGPGPAAEAIQARYGTLTFVHTALIPFGLRFDRAGTDLKAESILVLTHVLWMFLGMELVASKPAGHGRPARRRAQRLLKHHQVHVVVLRRISHPDDGRPVTHRDIDWSCRWVVQGHWRHLDPYEGTRHPAIAAPEPGGKSCEVCGSRITYVRPYIKGPDGKPLKAAGPVLYKLAR